ncbi:MAG: galactose-1-phosphate uridylyltransferase [Acidobacteriota bacterium]
MIELRKDPVVERWITIPRERAVGIEGLFPREEDTLPSVCPFCPASNNEREIFSIRDDQGNWRTRVVSDIRPILCTEGKLDRQPKGIYDRMNGVGVHEIVIESREHLRSWATMDAEQVALVFRTYRERFCEIRKDPRLRSSLVVKNYGGMASRFPHPHSHVVGLPIVPRTLVEEIQGAESYYRFKERCVWCDMRDEELKDPSRTVMLTDHVLVHAPYASRYPFELLIMPLLHRADFAASADDELADLAMAVRTSFEMLQKRLRDPSYTLIVHSAPFRDPPEQSYHWHIEVRPRLTALAGFEWGTGFFTNPIPPEVAASHLRG